MIWALMTPHWDAEGPGAQPIEYVVAVGLAATTEATSGCGSKPKNSREVTEDDCARTRDMKRV